MGESRHKTVAIIWSTGYENINELLLVCLGCKTFLSRYVLILITDCFGDRFDQKSHQNLAAHQDFVLELWLDQWLEVLSNSSSLFFRAQHSYLSLVVIQLEEVLIHPVIYLQWHTITWDCCHLEMMLNIAVRHLHICDSQH